MHWSVKKQFYSYNFALYFNKSQYKKRGLILLILIGVITAGVQPQELDATLQTNSWNVLNILNSKNRQ